ncbi:MAG TPA: 50S ribosomal protein L4 [Candidatus Polarisedimenticolaceae bacterium]|nr:50S ribosomal protein L4 [Candidatus Polarisedimenticolaceae bacterium]
MATIAVRDWNNKTLRQLELPEAVFGYPLKEHLIYEAVCAYRAGGRAGTHKTKNRVEVSGGTKKLWKQKHTGRARMGDNRSPLWRHGGTVQGPTPRDYSWKMPAAMRRNAIKSALAQKMRDGKIVCVDGFALKSHKTKDLEGAIAGKLGVTEKALLLPLDLEPNLDRAARNNPRLKVVRAMGMSIVDLLDHDTLIVSEPALKRLSEVLAS